MLTKNFNLIFAAVAANRRGSGGFLPDYVININGEKVTPVNGYSMVDTVKQLLNITNKHISEFGNTTGIGTFAFGTGTTAPKKSDYDLENTINDSDFSITSASASSEEDRTTLKQQITYSGANDVTITEIGYFYNYGTSNGGSIYYFPILIARQLIEPITIKQNDTFQVSMIIG